MEKHVAQQPSSDPASGLLGEARKKLKKYVAVWRSGRKERPPKLTWKARIALLTLSQWTYFFALLALLFLVQDGEWSNTSLTTVGLIAAVGISREIWHLFHRMWNTTLGKGVFLVLYAATANFAIAVAALTVNSIAGIEPTPLKFTLGFTTLIMLPIWIFIASVVLAAIMMMALNLWLLLVLLLRIIRIRLPAHWEDRSFVIVTMVLRLILLPIVISSLYFFIKPYQQQFQLFDTSIIVVESDLTEKQQAQLDSLKGAARDQRLVELAREGLVKIKSTSESNAVMDEEQPGRVQRLIAAFIYNFEMYPNSSCAKREQERVLTIDDYSMLVATKNDSPLGFEFTIKPCVPVYTTPSQNDNNGTP